MSDDVCREVEHLTFKLNELSVDAKIRKGLNTFRYDSATGKTRFMRALEVYSQLCKWKCILVNQRNYEFIKFDEIVGYKYVLLNNTELYDSRINFEELCRNNEFVITDSKDILVIRLGCANILRIRMQEDEVIID